MPNKKWTQYEKQFIADNATNMTDKVLAQELNKMAVNTKSGKSYTLKSVRLMRQRLGLKKMNGRGVCKIDVREMMKRDKSAHINN